MSKSTDTSGVKPNLPLTVLALGWVIVVLIASLSYYWFAPKQHGLGVILLSRLTTICTTVLAVLIATTFGMRLLRSLSLAPVPLLTHALFGAAVGMSFLSLLTLILSGLAFTSVGVFSGILFFCALASLREMKSLLSWFFIIRSSDKKRTARTLFHTSVVALIVMASVMMVLDSFVPPLDYDALEYHLGLPAQFYRSGGIHPVPSNVFSSFPQNVEMLYLLGMILARDVGTGACIAKLFNVAFAGLAALGAYDISLRCSKSRRAGFAAGSVVFLLPATAVYSAINVYVEAPLLFYTVMTIEAFLLHILHRQETGISPVRLLILCGVFSGLALGCKYTSALFLIPPVVLGIILNRIFGQPSAKRAVIDPIVFVLCSLAVFSPWLARNWYSTGNPVFPFLYDTLGGEPWSSLQAHRFEAAHAVSNASFADLGPRLWGALLADRGSSILLIVFLPFFPLAQRRHLSATLMTCFLLVFLLATFISTGHQEDTQVVAPFAATAAKYLLPWLAIGFLLSPLGVLPKNGGRTSASLWGLFVIWVFLWFALTHQAARFLYPVFFVLALLSATGFAALLGTRLKKLAQAVWFAGLALCCGMTFLTGIDGFPAAIGIETQEEYLKTRTTGSEFCYDAMQYINTTLMMSAHEKILFVGEAQTFYCKKPFSASTVFDVNLLKELDDRYTGQPHSIANALQADQINYLYINWLQIRRQQETYYKTDLSVQSVNEILQRMVDIGRIRFHKGFGRSSENGRWLFEIFQLLPATASHNDGPYGKSM